MDFHLRRAQILASLPRIGNRRRGTGAIPLSPDSRLKTMASFVPIETEVPSPQADLSKFVKDAYDQGVKDACVAYSIAGMQSTFQAIRNSKWLTFDAEALYCDNGGIGTNGISTLEALAWDKTNGLTDSTSKSTDKIVDFGFADPTTVDGISSIKSAISAKHPCVLALLLPSDFNDHFGGSGDCKGTITSDYHQVCPVGYDEERLTFLNSWGKSWGKNGIGTIAWSFLKDPSQAGSAYAYTVTYDPQPNAKPFYLKDWTDSAVVPPMKVGWSDKIEAALKVHRWLWIIPAVFALGVIGFLVNYHSQLFAKDTLRTWIAVAIALAVLVGANRAVFAPGPGNSDPTFVRYVIAFNAVIFIVVGLGILVIFIRDWGTPFFIAGASLLTGGFFGLLFGYPSGVAQQASTQTDPTKAGAVQGRIQNKNLLAESASTLGKLLTGFTLAKAQNVVPWLKGVCTSIDPAFAQSPHQGKLIASGVLAYFFATGFLSGLFLPSYFMSGKFGE